MKINQHKINQTELIYLLLNNKDLVEKFINSSVKIKDFDEEFHPIVKEIVDVYGQGYLLTRKGFKAKLEKNPVPKERIAQELEKYEPDFTQL